MTKFQERVKKLRKERGLKQAELAKEIGVSMYTVSLWERGERYPERKALDKLSQFFHVTVAYLEGDSYTRQETDEPEAVWLESDEFLEQLFEKMVRLSDDSRLMLKDMTERFLIADDTRNLLRPEGEYTVKISRHDV